MNTQTPIAPAVATVTPKDGIAPPGEKKLEQGQPKIEQAKVDQPKVESALATKS